MDQIDITVFVGLSSLSIQFETLICKCGALQSYSLPLSVAYLFYLYDMLHTHQHFLSFYFLFKYIFFNIFISSLSFTTQLSFSQSPNGGFCGGEGWVWDQNDPWILNIKIIING